VIDATSEREMALALQNVSTTAAPYRMRTASQSQKPADLPRIRIDPM
jgi:hypothetical protein